MDVIPAERLKKLPPYLFADLRRKIAAARESGVDVITLGIGDPDAPTPGPVVDELCRAVRDQTDADRHRYGCDQPVSDFPQAVGDFYKRRWDVTLEAPNILTTMGSKDAIAKLAMAIMNPGDIGIAPVPGYPTYNIGHVFASADIALVPLFSLWTLSPARSLGANVTLHSCWPCVSLWSLVPSLSCRSCVSLWSLWPQFSGVALWTDLASWSSGSGRTGRSRLTSRSGRASGGYAVVAQSDGCHG